MKLNNTTLLLGIALLLVAAPTIYTALGEAGYLFWKGKVGFSTSVATSLGAGSSPDHNSLPYDFRQGR
jgi:hypothetical protein